MKQVNLLRALQYIEEHINEEISLLELSKIAGYSVPQFYRLFKRLTGDTVGEYLVRRRMSMAAVDLKKTERSVSEIAYSYGFESHDVFTRAFKRVFGMTPSSYRQSTDTAVPLKRLHLESCESKPQQQMVFQVREIADIQAVGMECEATVWDQDGAIGKLWCDFLDRVHEIEGYSEPMVMYGICENETCRQDHFTYMAGVGVQKGAKIPQGMTARTIRGQKFFQASVPEDISTPDAYTAAQNYAKSLSFDVVEYDDIEVYEDIFQDPDCHSFQLLIPIQ